MSRRNRSRSLAARSFHRLAGPERLERRDLLANVTWSNGAGNNLWGAAGNWNPAGVPTAMDTAIFSGAAGLARLDANHDVNKLHSTAGAATIDLKKLNLYVNEQFLVRDSSLLLTNSGTDEVTASLMGPVIIDPELELPRRVGVPEIRVEHDGTLTTEGTFNGQTFLVGQSLIVGDDGKGTANVKVGSGVQTNTAIVGKDDEGAMVVGGDGLTLTNAAWKNTGAAVVGDGSAGSLSIASAGHVEIGTTLTIGARTTGDGTVTASGTSQLVTKGQVIVSDAGRGEFNVESNVVETNGAVVGKSDTAGAAEGKVNVTNQGSWFVGKSTEGVQSFAPLIVGQAGKGSVFDEGGDIRSGDGTIGEEATGLGSIWLWNEADWELNGSLIVGKKGRDARLTVETLSSVVVAGGIDIGLGEAGMLVGQNAHVKVLTESLLESSAGEIVIGRHAPGAILDVESGSVVQSGSVGGVQQRIKNFGKVNVTGATLRAGSLGAAGGGLLENAGRLNKGAGAIIDAQVRNVQQLAGIGTITGYLQNEADYFPGFEGLIGVSTIEDYFVHTGTLHTDIDGASDLVDVGGYASLGGGLSVSLLNDFVPQPWTATGTAGDWMHVLSAEGGLDGEFAGHNLPDVGLLNLPPPSYGVSHEWRIVYDRDDVTPDELLLHTHPSFTNQPWLGNGTQDVVLVIREVPYDPHANPDEYSTDSMAGSYLQVDAPGVLVNDAYAQATELVPDSGPFHGSLTFNTDGSFLYTPTVGYNGPDSFQYRAVNTIRGVASPPATVSIDVMYYPPNGAPDEYGFTSDFGGYLDVTAPGVLVNDSYADSAALVPDSGPDYGSLTFNSDGSFVYTPFVPYTGTDTFQYVAIYTPTGVQSAPVTVTINSIKMYELMLDQPAIASSGPALSMNDLTPIGRAAIARWRAAGVDEETLATRLAGLQFVIADLPGSHLAGAAGSQIVIDVDAAGHGWFIDASPGDDAEFLRVVNASERRAGGNSPAVGRVDLLTAVMHEIGHVLALEHSEDATNIMHETLSLGTRRLPTALDAATADYLFAIWQDERRE